MTRGGRGSGIALALAVLACAGALDVTARVLCRDEFFMLEVQLVAVLAVLAVLAWFTVRTSRREP